MPIQRAVSPSETLSKLQTPKRPAKVFTFNFTMTGQLAIAADSASDAYRLALMWSTRELAELADLEMDSPEEAGVVQ